MEKILKKIKTYPMKFADGTSIQVTGYTTEVAGLMVTRRVILRKDMRTNEIVGSRVLREWRIVQYPTGLNIVGDISTKAEALEIANKHLNDFNWVALLKKDIEVSNDMDKLRTQLARVRKLIREGTI